MRLTRFTRVLGLVFLVAACATACHRSASSVATESPGGTSPMNEKDRLQSEIWTRATQGLDFDAADGLVDVDAVFPVDAPAAEQHLAEGNDRLARNREMEALASYVLAVRHDPDRIDAWAGIGDVLKRKGKLDRAIASYRTALARDEAHADARYGLAMTLWAASRQDEAIREMNTLAAADDAHPKAHERLAVWNYYVGEYSTAWLHVHQAEALGQPVPAQLHGLLQERMPDPDAR